MAHNLQQIFEDNIGLYGEKPAITEAGGDTVNALQLAAMVADFQRELESRGAGPGDRVGLMMEKSIEKVAAIWAVLRIAAAYVPIDIHSPRERIIHIIQDCTPRVLLADKSQESLLEPIASQLSPVADHPVMAATLPESEKHEGDLSYILYTSGSTGNPKGVTISHKAAWSFVNWATGYFDWGGDEVFSSHAPFHFDLSIFDIYVSMNTGSTLVLFDHQISRSPKLLTAAISEHKITTWYSTPTTLQTMLLFGNLGNIDCASLRRVIFAGETFAISPLQELMKRWPHARFYNWYGPTETNVCTAFAIPEGGDAMRTTPYPIGTVCDHYTARVDESGELLLSGPGLMEGYWNNRERTDLVLAEDKGKYWYHTGDVVTIENKQFVFAGRLDRMIKRRGYRIEPGEIEHTLNQHPLIRQVACLAREKNGEKKIVAVIAPVHPSLTFMTMKAYAAQHLPDYMIPDAFIFRHSLPQSGNNKVDYLRLEKELV